MQNLEKTSTAGGTKLLCRVTNIRVMVILLLLPDHHVRMCMCVCRKNRKHLQYVPVFPVFR